MVRLKGKVALVTGASSGIGRATALLFAKEGARLIAVSRARTGEEVAETIRNEGGEAAFTSADVRKVRDVEAMIESAMENYGRLDILFNNAGVNMRAAVTQIEESQWDRIIDTNLKGVFLGCKYVIPIMKKQGGGVIINTSSTFANVGLPNFSAYCASKGGVAALTRAVAVEVAPYRIRVNCICPSTTLTPMIERMWNATGKPDEMRESRLKMHPIGRFGTPGDIANAALYLASDESSFVTGTSLLVDGGYTAQ